MLVVKSKNENDAKQHKQLNIGDISTFRKINFNRFRIALCNRLLRGKYKTISCVDLKNAIGFLILENQ